MRRVPLVTEIFCLPLEMNEATEGASQEATMWVFAQWQSLVKQARKQLCGCLHNGSHQWCKPGSNYVGVCTMAVTSESSQEATVWVFAQWQSPMNQARKQLCGCLHNGSHQWCKPGSNYVGVCTMAVTHGASQEATMWVFAQWQSPTRWPLKTKEASQEANLGVCRTAVTIACLLA